MEISFSKITGQIKEVILNPKDFWISKKDQDESQVELLTGYFLPVLLVVAVVVFLGEFFRSTHFYMGYAVLKALREVLLFVLEYYLAVFFTNEMMKTFGNEKNIVAARKLVVYSFTPLLLVSMVTGLFPFLYVLDILGLYSFYVFWVGVSEMLVFPDQKQSSYAIITIVVNFFVFSFLSILLSKLLTAYF
jgi:hypothetical protein